MYTAHKKRLSGPENAVGGKRQNMAFISLSLTLHLFLTLVCCRYRSLTRQLTHLCLSLHTPFVPHLRCSRFTISPLHKLFFCQPIGSTPILSLISLTSLPLCSLFCEPERGAYWVSLLHRLVYVCLSPSQWPRLWEARVALSHHHSVQVTHEKTNWGSILIC